MGNKTVAVCYDTNGGCKYVALVKNVTPSEYATLLKQQREQEQEQKRKERELNERIVELEDEIKSLKKEIKVLKGEDENEESI